MILAGMAATVVVLKRIQRVLHQALSACTVVAVGAARWTVACRSGPAVRRAISATTAPCSLVLPKTINGYETIF